MSTAQNIIVRGDASISDTGVRIDATAGTVRVNVTHLTRIVNSIMPGTLGIELHTIDRHRAGLFDVTGTGTSPDTDADRANYELATGSLQLVIQAVGGPVLVRGFPNAFGTAPPDFGDRAVVDFAGIRSILDVGRGIAGAVAPYLSIGDDGLVPANHNPDIDQHHYIRQGPLLIDLAGLDSGTRIPPYPTAQLLFALKTTDSLQLFATLAHFASARPDALAAGGVARSMYARGHFDAGENLVTAHRLGLHLIDP